MDAMLSHFIPLNMYLFLQYMYIDVVKPWFYIFMGPPKMA